MAAAAVAALEQCYIKHRFHCPQVYLHHFQYQLELVEMQQQILQQLQLVLMDQLQYLITVDQIQNQLLEVVVADHLEIPQLFPLVDPEVVLQVTLQHKRLADLQLAPQVILVALM